MPTLSLPTTAVGDSYLRGEREMCADEGVSAAHLDDAEANFDAFVRTRRKVRRLWGVPVTELWFVEGDEYIGTVVFRHELTEQLIEILPAASTPPLKLVSPERAARAAERTRTSIIVRPR